MTRSRHPDAKLMGADKAPIFLAKGVRAGFALIGIVLLALTGLVAACAAGEDTQPDTCPHRIGFVTGAGPLNDGGYNEAGYDGVIAGAEALGLSEDCYTFIESDNSADYLSNIEALVGQGHDILVASGFRMQAATRQAGRLHPDILFIGTDQQQVNGEGELDPIDNVAGLVFREEHEGFLAGALAGLVTETNVIGGVYGCELEPSTIRFAVGFRNGAAAVNPDVAVRAVYHPGTPDVCYLDPDFGAQAAQALVDEGADIIFGAGRQTGGGALVAACREGARAIGAEFDQYPNLPEAQSCILSSATIDLTGGVRDLIVAASTGPFTGGNVYGDVALAPYHNFEGLIRLEVQDQLADLPVRLVTGEIDACAPPNEGAVCAPPGR